MRLTLRTMLAYLDDILEPDDHAEIERKIGESEFASDLVQRVRDTTLRLRLDAPAIGSRRASGDPNTIAEYLDNTLPSERVAEVERLCLESDIHLAEVASCHQILTLVLGEPAMFPPALRDRMYRIPEVAAARAATAATTTAASVAAAGPATAAGAPALPTKGAAAAPAIPSTAKANAATTKPRERQKPEVPDYLRESRKSRVRTFLGYSLAALVAGAIITGIARPDLYRQFFGTPHFPERDQAAAGGDAPDWRNEKNGDKPADVAVNLPPPGDGSDLGAPPAIEIAVPPHPGGLSPDAPPPVDEGDDVVIQGGASEPIPENHIPGVGLPEGTPPLPGLKGDPGAIPPPPGGSIPGGSDPGGSVPGGSVPGEAGPIDAPPAPPLAEAPPVPGEPPLPSAVPPATGDAPPPPTDRIASIPPPPIPASETPIPPPTGDASTAVPPSVPAAMLVSPKTLLLRQDAATGKWQRLPARGSISYGEPILALPGSRPTLTLAQGSTMQLGGGTLVVFTPPEANGPQGIEIVYGRAVIIGAQGNRLNLRLGAEMYPVAFNDAHSTLAVEVRRVLAPGMNPEAAPAPVEVDLYAANGKLVWGEGADAVTVPAPAHRQIPPGPEKTQPVVLPTWIDAEPLSLSEQRAVLSLEEAITTDKPVALALTELVEVPRMEVRSLAARATVHLGLFAPFVGTLNDSDQRGSWNGHIETLREALALSPETARQVREAFQARRGEDGVALYRMLWGYTDDELRKGAAKQLVDYLDHSSLDYRVLAFWNLRTITGLGLNYFPESQESRRRQSIARWQAKLKAGEIHYPTGMAPPVVEGSGDAAPPPGTPVPPPPPSTDKPTLEIPAIRP